MRNFIIALQLCLLLTTTAFGWGGKGHDIITAIAQDNLDKKAAKKVAELLDDHSMVYYSSWMDEIRSMPVYKFTSPWHYANVDEGYTYETMPKQEGGDVVTATDDLIAQLKKGGLSDSVERFYFKMLIHTIADLHCPMHAGRKTDLGGNRYPVEFFRQQTSLHSLWDSKLIESTHSWSYSEWAKNLDIKSKKQKAEIAEGTPTSWFMESVGAAAVIYEKTEVDAKLSYAYITEFKPILEDQLYKGGLRLAKVVNDIYGK